MIHFQYILLAFLATFIFGLNAVMAKILLNYIPNPIQLILFQVVVNFVYLVILFMILLIFNHVPTDSLNLQNAFLIIISTIFIFFGLITLYKGLNIGNASVGSLILSTRVIISTFLAMLFLQELFPIQIYGWIMIILIGVFLTSWQDNLSLFEGLKASGTYYFFFTIFFWGIGNALVGAINNEVFILTLLIIRLGILCILSLISFPILNPLFETEKTRKISTKVIFVFIIYINLIVVADIGFVLALGESVTITEAIGAIQGVFGFIIVLVLSQHKKLALILKEPKTKQVLIVRSIGVTIATIGAILLTYDLTLLV